MKSKSRSVLLVASGFAAVIWSTAALAEFHPNMAANVSSVAHGFYGPRMLIMILCLVIALGVFSVLIYSTIRHRRSNDAVVSQFHENTLQEVMWTLIPVGILLVAMIPVTKDMMNIYGLGDVDLTVKVTGYPGKWHYAYVNEDISFFSQLSTPQIDGDAPHGENAPLDVDNPLVLPVGQKVRFLFTTTDVEHVWWVPEFGWKQDIIPGIVNEQWVKIEEPGVYRGQSKLPVVVVAKQKIEYKQWVREAHAAMPTEASGDALSP